MFMDRVLEVESSHAVDELKTNPHWSEVWLWRTDYLTLAQIFNGRFETNSFSWGSELQPVCAECGSWTSGPLDIKCATSSCLAFKQCTQLFNLDGLAIRTKGPVECLEAWLDSARVSPLVATVAARDLAIEAQSFSDVRLRELSQWT